MSEYPTAIFPSHTRKYNKDKHVFTDYGCCECVDIEDTNDTPLVFVKKHRPHCGEDSAFSQFSCPEISKVQSVDGRVLTPDHELMMLGKPEPIASLIDDDVGIEDLYSFRTVHSAKKSMFATAAHEFYNKLAYDHPDVTHGTFLDLIYKFHKPRRKTLCTGKSSYHFMHRKLFGSATSRDYMHHLDSSLCDVNPRLIRELLLEEMPDQAGTIYCDRDYSGGCLSYNSLGKSSDKQYGFLTCPQGQGLDELSIKLLSIDCTNKIDDEDSIPNSFSYRKKQIPLLPTISVGSEFRQTLNGRILQTDVVPSDSENSFIIGARSDNHVLLNIFNGNNSSWNADENSAEFTSDDLISTIGLIRTCAQNRVTSIALNPYIPGECVLATEDRCVRLWSPNMNSKSRQDSCENLEVLMTGTMGGSQSSIPWRQVCYAAHPRQLYVADSDNVCVFDLRTHNDSVSLINLSFSKYTRTKEKIFAISSGRSTGNEYECLVATNFNLFLMDQRYCKEPLVQWGTNMTFPPQYICPVQVATSSIPSSEFSSSNWSYNTMSVLLANQHKNELYSYQFCKIFRTEMDSNGVLQKTKKVLPPQCIGPPRSLGNFKDVKNYVKTKPSRYQEYLRNRFSKMTVGIEAITLDGSLQPDEGGVIVLQMNAVGDIGYQTLSMRQPNEAYDVSNLITGKTSSTVLTFEEERIQEEITNRKINNYEEWMKAACSAVHCKEKEGDFVTQTGIRHQHVRPHVEREISKSLFEDLLHDETDIPSKLCQLCTANCSQSEESIEPTETESRCEACGVLLSESRITVEFLKRRKKYESVLSLSLMNREERGDSQDVEDIEILVENLKLIDWEQTGEGYDNELGRLLKGTWNGTHQEYWEKVKCNELSKNIEEKRKQDEMTFDLGNRADEDVEKPKKDLEFRNGTRKSNPRKKSKRRKSILKSSSPNIQTLSPRKKRKITQEDLALIPFSSTPLISWFSSTPRNQEVSSIFTRSQPLPSEDRSERFHTSELNLSYIQNKGSSGSFSSPSKRGDTSADIPSFSFFSPLRPESSPSRKISSPRKNYSPIHKNRISQNNDGFLQKSSFFSNFHNKKEEKQSTSDIGF